MTDNPETAPTKRRPGRPRGSTSKVQAPQRSLPRGQYVGRNGEILSRQATGSGDIMEIPAHLKEKGWDYQWNTERVYNNPEVVKRHQHDMYLGGWRPVMATGRWNGVYGPPEDTGHIRIGDSGLYERPLGMTLEARAQEKKAAQQQVRDRDQALMGGKSNVRNLPSGYEMGGKYRGTGADLRMSIDPALDAPAPQHKLAEPGE